MPPRFQCLYKNPTRTASRRGTLIDKLEIHSNSFLPASTPRFLVRLSLPLGSSRQPPLIRWPVSSALSRTSMPNSSHSAMRLQAIGLTDLSSGPLAQSTISGSNSPKLVPARPTHLDLDLAAEDEDYRRVQDASDEGSDETWDARLENASTALPEAALGPDDTPGVTPPEPQEGMLPRDVQEKTAYYDYTSEKQLSQADAKLFYQRSKFESQVTGESSWSASQWSTRPNSPGQSPVIVPKSMGSVLEREQAGMQTSASTASLQSGRNVPQG